MRRRTDGFTLVELMVVVLVIGILVAIAVPVFNSARERAEWSTCQANQRMIYGAISAWEAGAGSSFQPYAASRTWGANGVYLVETVHFPDSDGRTLVPSYLKSYPVCPSVIRLVPEPRPYTANYFLHQHDAQQNYSASAQVHIHAEAPWTLPGSAWWSTGHSDIMGYPFP